MSISSHHMQDLQPPPAGQCHPPPLLCSWERTSTGTRDGVFPCHGGEVCSCPLASPPRRTTQPATRPPPRTLFSSPSPVSMRVCAPASTSAQRTRTDGGLAPPAFRGKAETCGAASSMVFQLPQPGHRPSQPETRTRTPGRRRSSYLAAWAAAPYLASSTTRTSGAPRITSLIAKWSSSRSRSTVLPRGKRPESTSSASRSST